MGKLDILKQAKAPSEASIPRDVDFLGDPNAKRLRREIQNIVDSYNHPWDVLAELAQNSVDAIRRFERENPGEKKPHRIDIEMDARERSIIFSDTGTGIGAGKLRELLAPHGGDKENFPDEIGEKGVGLTFTIFSCNSYELHSTTQDSTFTGHVDHGLDWRAKGGSQLPKFVVEHESLTKQPPASTGTAVKLSDIGKGMAGDIEDIFAQSINQIILILRTKTAIGNTRILFGGPALNVLVTLKITNIAGKTSQSNVAPSFWSPDELLADKSKLIDYNDFTTKAAHLSDAQKTKMLSGGMIRLIGSEPRGGRDIKYAVYCVNSRNTWKEFCTRNHLTLAGGPDGETRNLYEGGIYVSSKGMPSGITLVPPQTGEMSYWPIFFMLIEDDSITFDVGRKSIPNRTSGLLRDIAKKQFYQILPLVKYLSKDPATGSSPLQFQDKVNTFADFKKLPDLGVKEIGYLKHPDAQEGAVVAIFHELVGAGILKGYETYRTGLKQTYDLWGHYIVRPEDVGSDFRDRAKGGVVECDLVIEFKYFADSIMDDLTSAVKFLPDIDLIVCWDFDELKFAKNFVQIEPLSPDEILFYGSNYKLSWPVSYGLGAAGEKPILALRRFIDELQRRRSS